MENVQYTALKFIMLMKATELKFFSYEDLVSRCPSLMTDEATKQFNLAFNAMVACKLIELNKVDANGAVEFNVTHNIKLIADAYSKLANEEENFHLTLCKLLHNNAVYND